MNSAPNHPKGSRARVLLTSVFGPYAQDDAYGSRLINPMETLPQPSNTRSTGVLFANFQSLLGIDVDSSKSKGAMHSS